MSPKVKWRLAIIAILLCVIVLLYLILTCIPIYIHVVVISACGIAGYYNAREFNFLSRLGLNPRRGLTIPPALLNWLPSWSVKETASRRRYRTFPTTNNIESENNSIYPDASFNCSLYPRQTYMDRPDSNPSKLYGRTRLSSVNKRLSFGGGFESPTRILSPGRLLTFNQATTKSLGVLPQPWEQFHQKCVLKPRNTAMVQSAVRIAKPESSPNISTFFDHLNAQVSSSPESFQRQPAPSSLESVLTVLRESRKRDVDKEDKRERDGPFVKRSRHDSVGSASSGLEPMLANGAPSLLGPKTGQKRWLNGALAEESMTKRSRTSSISSNTGGPTTAGPRNPIHSSYSSSQAALKRKSVASESSSPSTSQSSPCPPTPVRVAKKLREETLNSPPSSSGKKTELDNPPASKIGKPAPETSRSTSSANSKDSGSQRRRKIPLVAHNKDGQIPLPPAPELGYTITVEDLDRERKATLSEIQKLLEEPEPEKPTAAPEATTTSTSLFSITSTTQGASTAAASSTTSTTTSSQSTAAATLTTSSLVPAASASAASLTLPTAAVTSAATSTPTLLGVAPAAAAAPAPTSAPAVQGFPGSVVGQPNPLLESLKATKTPVFGDTTTTTAAAQPTPAAATAPPMASLAAAATGGVKSEPSALAPPPAAPVTTAEATRPAPNMNSAFAQVLAQPLQIAPSSSGGSGLFGLAKPTLTLGAPTASLASTLSSSVGQPAVTAAVSTPATGGFGAATLPTSGFKPIFSVSAGATAPTQEAKPTPVTFTNIFGTSNSSSVFGQPAATSATATTITAAPTTMAGGATGGGLFGGLANNQSTSAAASQPSSTTMATPTKSLFGGWGTPTTAAATTAPAAATSTFQFGASTTAPAAAPAVAAPTSTAGSTGTPTFQFGAVQQPPAPAPAAQASASQGGFTFGQTGATATPFGGFGMGGTNAAAAATTGSSAATTQAAPAPVFGASASTAFGATTQASAVKPVTFGGAAAPAPAAATGGSVASPFTFGGMGSSTAGSSATAAPAFGAAGPTLFGAASGSSSTTGFSFGGAATAPAAPTTSAGPAVPTFGTPSTQTAAPPAAVANPTFTFGASAQNATASTPSNTGGFNFGTPNQPPSFSFGASTPSFLATSTPFNQPAAGAPVAFGSPQLSAQAQGFNPQTASPFGNAPMASFSIGAGSKLSARQRIQGRRTRKK